MPNTLAHIGIQGWFGRAAFKEADLSWVFAGIVIPDLPWILQRFVRAFFPGVDPYALRAYGIVQASFFGCLFLCAAVSILAKNPKRIFFVTAVNALFHLILDAAQYKWANGVHLFAPVSWKLAGFGWFWPEEWPSLLMAAAGVAFILLSLRSIPKQGIDLLWKPFRSLQPSMIFLAAYFTAPLFLLNGPYTADNHFIRTLSDKAHRTGKSIEIDRNAFRLNPTGPVLRTFFKEEIRLVGNLPRKNGILSLRGRFIDPGTIRVEQFHVHSRLRDALSYTGLAFILFCWTASFFQSLSHREKD